jgi:hypothetical protein
LDMLTIKKCRQDWPLIRHDCLAMLLLFLRGPSARIGNQNHY